MLDVESVVVVRPPQPPSETTTTTAVEAPSTAGGGRPPLPSKFRTFSSSTEESGVESPATSESQSGSSENGDFSRIHDEEETSDYPCSTPSPTSGSGSTSGSSHIGNSCKPDNRITVVYCPSSSPSDKTVTVNADKLADRSTGCDSRSNVTIVSSSQDVTATSRVSSQGVAPVTASSLKAAAATASCVDTAVKSSLASHDSLAPPPNGLLASSKIKFVKRRHLVRTKSLDLSSSSTCDIVKGDRRRRRTYPCLESDGDGCEVVSLLQLQTSFSKSNTACDLASRVASSLAECPAAMSLLRKSTKRDDSDLDDEKICKKVKLEDSDKFAPGDGRCLQAMKTGEIGGCSSQDFSFRSFALFSSSKLIANSSKLNSNSSKLNSNSLDLKAMKLKDDLNSFGCSCLALQTLAKMKEEDISSLIKEENSISLGNHQVKLESVLKSACCCPPDVKCPSLFLDKSGNLVTRDLGDTKLDHLKMLELERIKSILSNDALSLHKKATDKINEILKFDAANATTASKIETLKKEISTSPTAADGCKASGEAVRVQQPSGGDGVSLSESSQSSVTSTLKSSQPDHDDDDQVMSAEGNGHVTAAAANEEGSRHVTAATITAKSTAKPTLPQATPPSLSCSNSNSALLSRSNSNSALLSNSNSNSALLSHSNSNSMDAYEKTEESTGAASALFHNDSNAASALFNNDSTTADYTRPCTPVSGESGNVEDESTNVEKVFVRCKWKDCGLDVEDLYLLDHLKTEHLGLPPMKECEDKTLLLEQLAKDVVVLGTTARVRGGLQEDKDKDKEDNNLTCLWEGCKVYGAASSARGWLQKHITAHVGAKPFRCILDTCRARFSSQVALSRHVNSHFKPPTNNGSPGPRGRGGGGHTPDATTPIKFYIRKTRRKSRHRNRLVKAVNTIDLFDIGVMAGVKDALSKIKRRKDFAKRETASSGMVNGRPKKPEENGKAFQTSSDVVFDRSGTMVVLEARIICRRMVPSADKPVESSSPGGKGRKKEGKDSKKDGTSEERVEDVRTMCLVEYFPKGILDNEWVPYEEFKQRRRVPIVQLTPTARQIVHDHIFGRQTTEKQSRKTRPYLGPPRLT